MITVLKERPSLTTAELVLGGVRVRVRANSEKVLKALADERKSFGPPFVTETIDLRITVSDELCETSAPPHFRGMHHLVYMAFGGSSFLIDLLRKTVHGMVTKKFASDKSAWQQRILPIILGVLGPVVGVVPLHSACLTWKGKGLLLAGISGAGKSTLSVALAKEGMHLVSDDWTYLTYSGRDLRCHGVGAPVKLLADAVHHFPELTRLRPEISLNGELAFEVDPAATLGVSAEDNCSPSWMIFVERKPGPVRLRDISAQQVERFFLDNAERLPHQLADVEKRRAKVIRKVAALPAWSFQYDGTPQQGAQRLMTLMEAL